MSGEVTRVSDRELVRAYKSLIWSVQADAGWIARRLLDSRAPLEDVRALRDAGVPAGAWPVMIARAVPARYWHMGPPRGQVAGDWDYFARVWARVGDEMLDWHAVLGPDWSVIHILIGLHVPLAIVVEVAAIDPVIARGLHHAIQPLRAEEIEVPVEELLNWVRARLIRHEPWRIFQVVTDHQVIQVWRGALGDRAHRYAAAGMTLDEALVAHAEDRWTDEALAMMAALR